MKEIIFATGNVSKGKRFEEGLLKNDIKTLTLKDINLKLDVEENGETTTIYKKVSKKMVCDNICETIVDYIKSNYHFNIKVTHDAPNMDTNVHRTIIRLNGVLDTKYGDSNLVIYPTLR